MSAEGQPYLLAIGLALGLLSVGRAHATDINAATCSMADIQHAIDVAQIGNRVIVPSGTCTFTTTHPLTPSVILNKAITVLGQTVCTGAAETLSCTDETIINVNTGTKFNELPFYVSVSGARLSGFTLSDARHIGGSQALIKTAKGTTDWRIDHIHVTQPANATVKGIEARGSGLIDHTYIDTANTAVYAWGERTGDTVPGDLSWTETVSPGSPSAVYVEDSKFAYTSVLNGIDNYAGGRIVFRYNYVEGTNIGSHGLDSGGLRSNLLLEVYGNIFTNPGTHIAQWFVSRGGTFLVWNNTIDGSGGSYDTFLDLRNYRSDSAYSSSWGACDGTNVLDQNAAGGQGWGCKDQLGRGPNQTSFPAYSWLNNWKGVSPTISNVNICGYQDCVRARTYHLKNNREFYLEAPEF